MTRNRLSYSKTFEQLDKLASSTSYSELYQFCIKINDNKELHRPNNVVRALVELGKLCYEKGRYISSEPDYDGARDYFKQAVSYARAKEVSSNTAQMSLKLVDILQAKAAALPLAPHP